MARPAGKVGAGTRSNGWLRSSSTPRGSWSCAPCPTAKAGLSISSRATRTRSTSSWPGSGKHGVFFGAGTRKRRARHRRGRAGLVARFGRQRHDPEGGAAPGALGCSIPRHSSSTAGAACTFIGCSTKLWSPSTRMGAAAQGPVPIFAGDPKRLRHRPVMRLPGSINSKYGDPHAVRVIEDTGRRYSLADLQDWVAWQRELVGEPQNPFLAAAGSGIAPSWMWTGCSPTWGRARSTRPSSVYPPRWRRPAALKTRS